MIHIHGSANGSFCGVGRGLVKHSHLLNAVMALQRVKRFLQNAYGFDPWVGHDQRAFDVGFVALRAKRGEHAKVNLDVGEVENLSHGTL